MSLNFQTKFDTENNTNLTRISKSELSMRYKNEERTGKDRDKETEKSLDNF